MFSGIVLAENVSGVNNNFGERLTADLAINKSDGQTTAVPGTAITYTITITNNGPSTVNSLTMSDPVPAAILSPSFSGASSGTYNSGTGAWTGLNLATGQSITIQVSGTINPSITGNLVNTATVSGAMDSSGDPILDPVSSQQFCHRHGRAHAASDADHYQDRWYGDVHAGHVDDLHHRGDQHRSEQRHGSQRHR